MEVLYAVDLGGGVYSEGHPVQTAAAHHTVEAARVVSLAHSPQDPVQDGLGALGATLQGTLTGRITGRKGWREGAKMGESAEGGVRLRCELKQCSYLDITGK